MIVTVVALFVALVNGFDEIQENEFIYTMIPGFGYYKAVAAKVRWEKARRVCASHHGHLLILNSPEEAEAIIHSFPSKGWKWLGFDEYNNYNDFITLQGTTLDEAGFNTWAPNQPENSELYSTCGAMTKNGQLAVMKCNESMEYICEMSEKAVEYPPWVAYSPVGDHGFYRVHWERVRWETARRICEKEGAHLMVPNTLMEVIAVFEMARGREEYFWLGFDSFDGDFVNFDGEQIGKSGVYSTWFNGKRGEHKDEIQCGAGYHYTGELITLSCNKLYSFICELYKPGEKSRFTRSRTSSPPSGYKQIGDSYYKKYSEEKYWESARRACEAEGAHLLVVNSYSEQHAVNNDKDLYIIYGSRSKFYHFIGFDDFDASGDYEWFDGSKERDFEFYIPSIGSCGCLDRWGPLIPINCYIPNRYICEWEKPGTEKEYANSYRHVDGFGFYRFHRDKVAWETARRRCESEGAYLMVINSRAEAVVVLEYDKQFAWRWVGFEDFDTEGTFRTVLNTTLKEAGYEEWNKPDPETRSCGVVNSNTKRLGTFGCEDFKPYICELKK